MNFKNFTFETKLLALLLSNDISVGKHISDKDWISPRLGLEFDALSNYYTLIIPYDSIYFCISFLRKNNVNDVIQQEIQKYPNFIKLIFKLEQ